jgi:hypothetical protein
MEKEINEERLQEHSVYVADEVARHVGKMVIKTARKAHKKFGVQEFLADSPQHPVLAYKVILATAAITTLTKIITKTGGLSDEEGIAFMEEVLSAVRELIIEEKV